MSCQGLVKVQNQKGAGRFDFTVPGRAELVVLVHESSCADQGLPVQ